MNQVSTEHLSFHKKLKERGSKLKTFLQQTRCQIDSFKFNLIINNKNLSESNHQIQIRIQNNIIDLEEVIRCSFSEYINTLAKFPELQKEMECKLAYDNEILLENAKQTKKKLDHDITFQNQDQLSNQVSFLSVLATAAAIEAI